MKIKHFMGAAVVAVILGSCATPKNINYFQDAMAGQTEMVLQNTKIVVMPEDRISIVVNSRDPQLADLFNLPIVSHRVGYTQGSSLNANQQISTYTVDAGGYIDFPVLGKIKVGGKNRQEIAEGIKNTLMERNLVNDPVVTVDFANMFVNVIGEVNNPGRYTFDRDHVTLLDAISMAGDLTIYGVRTDVLVIREYDGVQSVYAVDLTSDYDLLQSPAYYLQQKDVVYVKANDTRARQSTVNGNNARQASTWVSIASVLVSLAVLIFK